MNELQNGPSPEAAAVQQYHDHILSALIHPTSESDIAEGTLAISLNWETPQIDLRKMLFTVVEQSSDEDILKRIYPLFANRLGLAAVRKLLRQHAQINPDFEKKLNELDRTLGFSTEANPKNTLDELYKAIGENFKEYQPNHELIQKETDLLKKVFVPDAQLLDLGCGPKPRHMIQLLTANRTVIGIDYAPDNVRMALADHQDLDIRQADWQQLPFPDSYFDGAYSLGRSLLHNTTVADWIVTLQEIWRVMNHDDPVYSPKALVLDIPNADKGDYAYEIKRFHKTAKKLGIHDYEYGTIHDSPDGIHFFDRFVPTQSQFETIAKVSGFTPILADQKNYTNTNTGRVNQNQYWVLINNNYPLTYSQSIPYMRDLTTKAIVDIDISHMLKRRPMTWKELARR